MRTHVNRRLKENRPVTAYDARVKYIVYVHKSKMRELISSRTRQQDTQNLSRHYKVLKELGEVLETKD